MALLSQWPWRSALVLIGIVAIVYFVALPAASTNTEPSLERAKERADELIAELVVDTVPSACRSRDYAYEAATTVLSPDRTAEDLASLTGAIEAICRERDAWLGD